ncbi:MAG TPA: hypothetical protein VMV18_07595, partial [bacterium]|nr:hypothetical protein [bacterium]
LGGAIEHAFSSWRAAFYVAGAPGLLLAALCLLIEEPPRATTAAGGGAASHHGNFLGSLGDLLRIPMYRYAVLGYIAYTFSLGGFSGWAAEYLDARMGLPLNVADRGLGIILLVTGFAGTAVGGFLGDRWARAPHGAAGAAWTESDRTRGALRVCWIFTALAAPFALVTLLAGSPTVFFAAIGVTEFFLFVSTAPVNAALLGSVPAELRASAMALSIFAIHLFGDLISPPAIGTISDALRGPTAAGVDPMAAMRAEHGGSLRTAMFILPVMIAVGAFLWWRGATRRAASPSATATPASAGAA